MQSILRLLHTILQHNELALHIQHVKIPCSPGRPYDMAWKAPWHEMDWSAKQLEYSDVVEQAQAIVNKVKFPNAEKWNKALQDGNPYAFVTIILSQLHNLKSFQLDYSFVWMLGFPGLMLRHALFSAPLEGGVLSAFNSLRMVDYGGNVRQSEFLEKIGDFNDVPGYPICDSEQFMAWFYLPSIQSLSIWLRSTEGVLNVNPNGQQPKLHQLHTLLLPRTTIDEADVSPLLSKTTSLRTLHLGMAYRWHEQCALQNGPAILEGLSSVSDTVEKLSLALEYYPFMEGYYYFDYTEDPSLRKPFYGFLKQFSKLSSVEVPITLLLGLDPEAADQVGELLPNTLQEICLHWDCSELGSNPWWSQKQLLDIVQYLLNDLESHTPHIKRITIRIMDNKDQKSCLQEREEVQARCADTGIEMNVVFDELSPGLWTHIF